MATKLCLAVVLVFCGLASTARLSTPVAVHSSKLHTVWEDNQGSRKLVHTEKHEVLKQVSQYCLTGSYRSISYINYAQYT